MKTAGAAAIEPLLSSRMTERTMIARAAFGFDVARIVADLRKKDCHRSQLDTDAWQPGSRSFSTSGGEDAGALRDQVFETHSESQSPDS